MSNENIFERLFRLWSAICKMIVDGARDPYEVAEMLQAIIDGSVVMAKKYLRLCASTIADCKRDLELVK